MARLRSEQGEVASWLILMAALAAAALSAGLVLTMVIEHLANDVVEAVEGNYELPETIEQPTGDFPDGGDPDDPSGQAEGDPDADALPERTLHCILQVRASAAAVGLGVGVGGEVEVIIQQLPDGRQLVTFAGEAGVNGGEGTSAGAGITINDATVGAYAAASAKVWGAVGAGVQYELQPGETIGDLLTGLAVSSNPVTGLPAAGINTLFPDTVPTAPLPDTVFIDGEAWGEAGATAQAGIGWVSAGAAGSGNAGVNQTYAVHADGTYSATTTYSGALSATGHATGGIPFFAWGSTDLGGSAEGSVSVQTVFDGSFNPVEMVVTTTYGVEGDLTLGEDDPATITTQQWTIDLSDPEVREAVGNIDDYLAQLAAPVTGLPNPELNPPTVENPWDTISDHVVTSGPLTQELGTDSIDIDVFAGAIVAGVGGGVDGTCTTLQ